MNEALDSFQSVWAPRAGLLPEGHYYNHFALPIGWTARERGVDPERWRTSSWGWARTAVRVLEGVAPESTSLETVGIEVDREVLRIAEEHFDLERGEPDRVAIGDLDGRAALAFVEGLLRADHPRRLRQQHGDPAPPRHGGGLRAYRDRLTDGGWLTVNVGGFGADDPVIRAWRPAPLRPSDGEVFLGRVPLSRNWVIHARRDARVPSPASAPSVRGGRPSRTASAAWSRR